MGSFQGEAKCYQGCSESGDQKTNHKRLSLRYVTDWGCGDTEESIMYIKRAEFKYRSSLRR